MTPDIVTSDVVVSDQTILVHCAPSLKVPCLFPITFSGRVWLSAQRREHSCLPAASRYPWLQVFGGNCRNTTCRYSGCCLMDTIELMIVYWRHVYGQSYTEKRVTNKVRIARDRNYLLIWWIVYYVSSVIITLLLLLNLIMSCFHRLVAFGRCFRAEAGIV